MTFSKISSIFILTCTLLQASPALAQSVKGMFVGDMTCDPFEVINPYNKRTETYYFSLASGMNEYEKSGGMIALFTVETPGSYPDTILSTGKFTRTPEISRFESASKELRVIFVAESKDPKRLSGASLKAWMKNDQNKWELYVDQTVNCTAIHQMEGGSVGSHNKN